MLRSVQWTYVLIAHGTIESLDDLPEFLLEIRRGRPFDPSLLEEMRHRYEQIGHSPLLEHTLAQASALSALGHRPARVAMRLSRPRFGDVIADLPAESGICLIPIAPFSVQVYRAAALRELESRPQAERPAFCCVQPWGERPSLIDAWVDTIQASLFEGSTPRSNQSVTSSEPSTIVLTAHSLPQAVIRSGDPYQTMFENAARAVAAHFATPVLTCFQSQGADGGDWVGPSLEQCLEQCARDGTKRVVVAPIGFLAEHVETLYDLDIEARSQAQRLGLDWIRVPALNTHPGLIATLHDAAEAAIEDSVVPAT